MTGSYFDRIDIPALISYPDDPEAIKEGQKAITIMEAVSMLKQHKHPRLTMGIQRGPWIRLDNQIYWKELLKNRKIDNINAFAEILSM